MEQNFSVPSAAFVFGQPTFILSRCNYYKDKDHTALALFTLD